MEISGFLRHFRDTISSDWHDLDNSYTDSFLHAAKSELDTNSFDNLKEKVDSAYKQWIQNFWENVITEHGNISKNEREMGTVMKKITILQQNVPAMNLPRRYTAANNEGSQHLLLDLAFKFKYIPMDNEASGSQLASSFLLVVAGYFNGNLFIYPMAFW
ncbi:hypothetical protein F8M41_002707 [Gigaspora margarita]|uniref:Uncharacterized protein n=1 Tax=Gigaspora margarita TaxID=4874 RepID=A0A8H4AYJ3_GIGMA|nr:hypothetical protein F8M41_002707 [Gigaspora margarita]